jgi:hypothetical protein
MQSDASLLRNLQGSNILNLAAPSRVAWGLLKIDQGRSLLRVTTRMFESNGQVTSTSVSWLSLPTTWISCPAYQSTLWRPNTHPRGYPTIHLSKSITYYVINTCVFTSIIFSVTSRRRGSGILQSIPPVSTGVANIFRRVTLVD